MHFQLIIHIFGEINYENERLHSNKSPFPTGVDGYVYDSFDSLIVIDAEVVIIYCYNWDDTTVIIKTKSDSIGYYKVGFDVPVKHGLYYATAKKDGFSSSSFEMIDGGCGNRCDIYLYH